MTWPSCVPFKLPFKLPFTKAMKRRRLLRQDLVAPLIASARLLNEAGGVRSLRHGNQQGGRFTGRGAIGGDEVSMFVYRNVKIEAVRYAGHAGAFFQVSALLEYMWNRVYAVHNFPCGTNCTPLNLSLN